MNSFIKLFQTLGLNPRTVSTTFGCRVNIAICLRGASDPDPAPVYVDQRALRNDRVTLVEKGSPHSLCLLESGKVISLKLVLTENEYIVEFCSIVIFKHIITIGSHTYIHAIIQMIKYTGNKKLIVLRL